MIIEDKDASKWQVALLILLYLSVISMAIFVVMQRHQSRALFVQSEKLAKQHNILIAQWSRLKLEQGVVLNEIYVERKARADLGMLIPKAKNIRMVKE
ncbi:MAG TPA: cell division protein FtsL [Leucothrix mucor]|uniref:Cell division protein FtsL n=1 Tax=Leucothrix mucor TaxID=45248 RepID=A0A7V2WVR6_LEUMU|nr:cell division protein FtsL [Leucothrix mucor]